MTKSRILGAWALALSLIAPAAVGQTTWQMPTAYPDTNFQTKLTNGFAKEVAAATDGALLITVHSNGSLIKHPDIKRAVQTGQVPIGELLSSVQANESTLFAFDSNPFLATTYDEQRKLWMAAKGPLEKRLNKQGLTLLYSVPWPPQGLYTKAPIESLADLKGMKFRTYSPVTSRLAELAGAVPTTVQVPEVPQAFRTGLVDIMLTAASTGVDTQAWDYLNYFYDVRASMPHNIVIAKTSVLDKLDPAVRDKVMKIAAETEQRGWEASQKDHAVMVETMRKNGIKIEQPSAKLVAEFQAIGKTITEEWIKRTGDDGAAIVSAYQASR